VNGVLDHLGDKTDIDDGGYVPFREILVVENNHSGQFYRYMRSETGVSVDGHIRKYDGVPLLPKHVVNGVVDLLGDKKDIDDGVYVPFQEILV
jgi:pyruvate/2-oxoacid:ferredoxin oxidoreductase alpha subunit